ncbi:hypothetical protein [Alloactinosynnema sp. L-07]|nr:hypothetical protein [Alloactinosynnema sp. L-07]
MSRFVDQDRGVIPGLDVESGITGLTTWRRLLHVEVQSHELGVLHENLLWTSDAPDLDAPDTPPRRPVMPRNGR